MRGIFAFCMINYFDRFSQSATENNSESSGGKVSLCEILKKLVIERWSQDSWIKICIRSCDIIENKDHLVSLESKKIRSL